MTLDAACILCGGPSRAFFQEGRRDYRRCLTCGLTFVPARDHCDSSRELERYRLHRNSPEDAGYRDFLERLLVPLAQRLAPGARGLDYGCGPGPAVSSLLARRGFRVRDYDPFFAPDPEALQGRYEFIVCTEVLEHLRQPLADLRRLDGLLAAGGVLGVLTGVLEDDDSFPGWWYRRDITHIAFYRPETLEWIARRHGWGLERPSRDAALFLKPL